MKYLETKQVIPNKGMSYTMYEIEGIDEIKRMLTYIPDQDEIHPYPKPPIKKLYKPEMCKEIEEEVFSQLWELGLQKKNS